MSCCPPNAEKFLSPTYTTTGFIKKLPSGLEVYTAGLIESRYAVILLPDIFGWNSGRTRNVADILAETGYYSVVPKLLTPSMDGGTDGDGLCPDFDMVNGREKAMRFVANFPWEEVLKPRVEEVVHFLKNGGITKIALLGFCWGGFPVAHALTGDFANDVVCAAIAHPSITIEERLFKRDTQALIDRIEKPVLFMPALGDPDEYRLGGAYYETIKAKYPTSETVDFPTVNHGFMVRGDMTNNAVLEEAVKKAIKTTLEFFAVHF